MATIDLIPAPGTDAVTFRLPRWRLWLGTALTLAPLGLLVGASYEAVTTTPGGSPQAYDMAEVVRFASAMAVGGATGAIIGAGRRLGWVRVSTAGLEFASSRRKPVFLPWSAVQSVGLRLAGPLTELIVTPTSLHDAVVVPAPGWAPRRRRGSKAPAFLVDVGMMTPRPTVLLAELDRRLAAHHSDLT